MKEGIAQVLKENITLHSIRNGYGVFNISSFEEITNSILALIQEAHKVRGEPPVLSEKELELVAKGFELAKCPPEWKWIARAQRDADVRFYNG